MGIHRYWYDALRQVTRHERGDLVPGPSPAFTGIDAANRQQQEIFDYDETGNWKSENIQNPALAQTRIHNPANQITGISGPGGAVQPAYDPAGNMTLMPRTSDWTAGDELTWDAWNRLTRVRPAASSSSSSSGSSSSSSSSSSNSEGHSSSGSYHSASSSSGLPSGEIQYEYDALTRRTRKSNIAGTIDYYYDKQWRAVQESVAGSVTAHYVWSPIDRWTMIRRKRGSEELYVLKDYLDPSAIINTGATVIERFGYNAFGPVRFMDAEFEPCTSTIAAWNFLYHAEFLDEDTGLYNYGYRYYSPQIGRWLSRDPIGERGGVNLYGFVSNSPLIWIDFLGWNPTQTSVIIYPVIPEGRNNKFERQAEESLKRRKKGESERHIAVEGIEDANRKLKVIAEEDCCIRTLDIIGHGWSGHQRIGSDASDDGYYDNALGIKKGEDGEWVPYGFEMFKDVFFCKPCFITLRGCAVGLGDGEIWGTNKAMIFTSWLAQATGCTILGFEDLCYADMEGGRLPRPKGVDFPKTLAHAPPADTDPKKMLDIVIQKQQAQ